MVNETGSEPGLNRIESNLEIKNFNKFKFLLLNIWSLRNKLDDLYGLMSNYGKFQVMFIVPT